MDEFRARPNSHPPDNRLPRDERLTTLSWPAGSVVEAVAAVGGWLPPLDGDSLPPVACATLPSCSAPRRRAPGLAAASAIDHGILPNRSSTRARPADIPPSNPRASC